MFGWLAQIYDVMSGSLLAWIKTEDVVGSALTASESIHAVTQASVANLTLSSSQLSDSLSSKYAGISNTSATSLLNSAEWLSQLAPPAVFEVNGADVPVFSISPETEVISFSNYGHASRGWNPVIAASTLLPLLLLTPKHPMISITFLLLQQLTKTHAELRVQDIYSDVRDKSDAFEARSVDIESTDITNQFTVQDVTEQYRGRRLQDMRNASQCQSGVVLPGAWALMLGAAQGSGVAIKTDGSIVVTGSISGVPNGLLLAQFYPDGTAAWANVFSFGSGYSAAGSALVLHSDNSIVVAGYVYGIGAGNNDVLLAQFYANGTIGWAKTLGGSYQDIANALALSPDGMIVVAGNSGSFGAGSNSNDVLLAQFNASGVLMWASVFGGSGVDLGYGVALCSDGEIIVTGSTNSLGTGSANIFLAQFSVNGTLSSVKTLGTGQGKALAIGYNDTIVLTGMTSSVGAGGNDVLLAQFDIHGTLLWAKALGGTNTDNGFALALRSEGGIVVSGLTSSFGAGSQDLLLAEFTANGTLCWAKTLGGTGQDNGGRSLVLRPDGGIVMTGSIASFTGSFPLFLARFSLENDIPSLTNTLLLQQIPSNIIMSLDVTNALSQQNWSSVILQNVTRVIIQVAVALPISYNISSSTITAVSLIVNSSAFSQVSDTLLTFQLNYMLPLKPFAYLASQPAISVDVGNASWVSYDATQGILSGTPITVSSGQQSIQLLPDTVVVQNVGAMSIQLQMNLCVIAKKANTTWIKTFGGINPDISTALALGSDGNIIVAGYTSSFGVGSQSALLAQFTSSGDLVWATTLGSASLIIASSLAVRSDSAIIITGYKFGISDYDVLLAQFNSNGTLVWAKTLGGTGMDQAFTLALRPDDGMVVGAQTSSFGASTSNYAVLLIELDATGALLWGKIVGGSNSYGIAELALRSDGGITWIGMNMGANWNIMLAQHDINGTLIWTKIINGIGQYWGNALVVSSDDSVTITGSNLLARFDISGSVLWATTLPSTGQGLALCLNDEVIVTGITSNNLGAGNGDVLLAKFNVNGSLLWANTIGGVNQEQGAAATFGTDGKIIITGYTQSFGAGSYDVLLGQFYQDGTLDEVSGASISIQPISASKFFNTSLNLTDLTGTTTTLNVVPIINNTVSFIASSAPLLADSLLLYYFQQMLFPVQLQNFGQLYQLNFNNYLYHSTSVLKISGLSQAFLPSWLQYNTATKILSGTPTGTVRGEYWINMNLQKNGIQQEVTFIINVLNTVPYYAGNTTLSARTGRFIFPLGVSFRDAEGDPLYPFALAQLNGELPPPIASIDSISGRLFGTALSGDQGVYQFNVTVSDPYSGLDWEVITVNIANTAPNVQYDFTNSDPVTVGNTFSYSFPNNAFGDRDGDPVSYAAVVPAFLTFNPSSRTLSGTPDAVNHGVYTVYFFATDPYGGVSNVSITVDINGIPAQQISLSALTVTPVGISYNYSLPVGLFADPDGDAVHYALIEDIQHIKPSWLFFNASTNTLSGTPNNNAHQPIPIRFTASDGRGGQTFYDVSLSVPNSAPLVINGVANQSVSVNQVKTMVISNAAFNDADNDVLTYQLVNLDGSTAPDFSSIATNTMTFVPRTGTQGVYVLRLIASDPFDASANTTFVVTIPNRSPMLMEVLPRASLVTTGNSFTYSFSGSAFSDQDGDAIQYAANYPAFLNFDVNTRTFSGTPNIADRGLHNLVINATDSYGGLISKIVSMIVNGIPVQQMSLSNLTTTLVNVAYSFVFPAGFFIDPDGDTVSYVLTEDLQHPKPSWLSFDTLTQRLFGTPNSNSHQPMPIRFIVSDGRGGQTFFDTSLVIPNSPPVVSAGLANQTIAVNQVRSQVVPSDAFIDADRDSLIYTLNLLSGRSQSWLSFANGVITFFPRSGDQGNYQFTLQADDGHGGTAELIFSTTVPNHAPRLVYPIPVPVDGHAGQAWTMILDANNFIDEDQDTLTYVASRSDDTTLPNWLHFEATRKIFQGTPSGIDRGILPVKLRVSDQFGGEAAGFFNISIINSAPVAQGRIFDQQVSQTENSFTFTVSGFDDPDGDAVIYLARMQNGEILPSWLHFDPVTRTFTAFPKETVPGNYLLTVVAIDSQGQNQTASFNIAIQAPPNIDLGKESTLQKLMQYIVPVSGGVGLLICVGLLLMWRERRLNETNKKIQAWSTIAVAREFTDELMEFSALEQLLQQFTRHIRVQSALTQLEGDFSQFELHVKQYYKMQPNGVPMTSLLSIDTVGELLKYISRYVLELKAESHDNTHALNASRLLHAFLGLILSEYTGRGHHIAQKLKEGYYTDLDDLMNRLPKRDVYDIQVFHELNCAREALICMRDTNTLLLLAKASLLHLLSPGNLVKDMKTLIFDFPSKWYVMLLEMMQLATRAKTNATVLLQLQSIAARESDWRFRFGMVSLLLTILVSSTNEVIRAKALHGKETRLKITQLGFMHLLNDKTILRQPSHVSREAVRALNDVSDQLTPESSTALAKYIDHSEGRARRVSVLRAIPSDIKRDPESKPVPSTERTNPLFMQRGPHLLATAARRVPAPPPPPPEEGAVGVLRVATHST